MYTFTLNPTSRHNYTIFKQFLLLNLIILKICWGVITNWDLLSQQKSAVWINSPHNCLHKYVADIHDMFPSHNIFGHISNVGTNNHSRSILTEIPWIFPSITFTKQTKLPNRDIYNYTKPNFQSHKSSQPFMIELLS